MLEIKDKWKPSKEAQLGEMVLLHWSEKHGFDGSYALGAPYEDGWYYFDGSGDSATMAPEPPSHYMELPEPPTDVHPDLQK